MRSIGCANTTAFVQTKRRVRGGTRQISTSRIIGSGSLSETNIVQSIRLALSRGAVRIFRNNRGRLKDERGRWVSFGIGDPGGADLIGWRTVRITPDMVGQSVAQFLSIEVKRPGGRTDKKRAEDQKNWRDAVNNAGGIGLQVTSVAEAEAALLR